MRQLPNVTSATIMTPVRTLRLRVWRRREPQLRSSTTKMTALKKTISAGDSVGAGELSKL